VSLEKLDRLLATASVPETGVPAKLGDMTIRLNSKPVWRFLSLITDASLCPPKTRPARNRSDSRSSTAKRDGGALDWHSGPTNHVDFVTDTRGLIAVDAPDLDEPEVYFHVQATHYEIAADGFAIAACD